MTDDEIIAVVQAHKEGKRIEVSGPNGGNWSVTSKPQWDFQNLDYRVAPEPRKPREIRLVYKGSGTWREWMHEDGPCIEKSVLFREVEINGTIN